MKNKGKNLLVESLLISKNLVHNIDYHNRRMNRSMKELYGIDDFIDLKEIITIIPEGLHKCRVIYSDRIHEIHYLPCHVISRKSFRFIESNISYRHKYVNREKINSLLAKKGEAEDVIIVKNGLVTDASSSNVAFFDGSSWITPASPLLPGTTRQRYLDSGLLTEKDITVNEAEKFKKMALLNAIIDFQIIENPRFYQ